MTELLESHRNGVGRACLASAKPDFWITRVCGGYGVGLSFLTECRLLSLWAFFGRAAVSGTGTIWLLISPAQDTVPQPCCWTLSSPLSSRGEAEGTVNLDRDNSESGALLWSRHTEMYMGRIWCSPVSQEFHLSKLEDWELAALLLFFLIMLWCPSWGVLCCCSMAQEDKAAATQWVQAAGVTKVLHSSGWWRREV